MGKEEKAKKILTIKQTIFIFKKFRFSMHPSTLCFSSRRGKSGLGLDVFI